MPCSDSNAWAEDIRRERFQKMTRMLCKMCKLHTSQAGVEIPDEEVRKWWEEHQKNPGHEKD